MVDFETEKICLNQIINQKKDNFCAEENIIIPDVKPDILSTIDSSGNVYIYKKEIVNGRLKIDGGVYTYVMYIADNEQNDIRGLHTVIDFSQSIEIEKLTQDMDFDCDLNIRNIECKILNGRKINIKINLEANIKVFSNNEKEFVKSINDTQKIQMISNSTTVNSLKGKGETVAIAKDTITINDNLADILSSDISIKNKDIKINYLELIQNINIDIKNIDLNVNIGTEDAGITAILVGILAGILGIIIKKPKYQILPIYANRNLLKINLNGIFTIYLMHYIYKFIKNNIKERFMDKALNKNLNFKVR